MVNSKSDAILHGTWVKREAQGAGWLLVWGEQRFSQVATKARGRLPKVLRHPYAVSSEAVGEMLRALFESLMLDGTEPDTSEGEAILTLPVVGRTPIPSRQTVMELEGKPRMSDCRVDAVYLSALDAVKLLSAIPLSQQTDIFASLPCGIGTDIRFWSAVAKFAFHLISQHKFVPMLREEEGGFVAFWEPVLDDPSDAEKLETLVRMMPDACRSVSMPVRGSIKLAKPHPRGVVLDFLSDGINEWVRNHAERSLVSGIPRGLKDQAVIRWLTALTEPAGTFPAPDLASDLRSLCQALDEWRNMGVVSQTRPGKFRTCFRLEPPEDEDDGDTMPALPDEDSAWTLRYFLQALDDPSLLVPADVVWRERGATLRYLNRDLESPQERMLTGLGMAARMFPPIERSLRQARPRTCSLTTEKAYQFLSEASLLLQQSGFGVLAPPWWTEKKAQIKAKLSVSPPTTAGVGFFSLDTLVQYDWKLALGGELITPEELEHLAKLKIPLVRVRGEWVMLRPEDIQAAMEFFKKRGKAKEISLGDAVRLSLGESPELEGIQVEEIEAPDWLDSLVKNLKSGKLSRLRQPKEFVGKLRPYQLSGMSWLAFMRQWGLGACLADDMGLGKCGSGDSLVFVNGSLLKAEDIWAKYAGEAGYDGEGFWASPTNPLIINALDGESGRIVQAPIRHLYRQRVREKLRTIRLEDGSSITVTRRHKLLTNRGWTHELRQGDYVCVPAKMVWDGKPEDPDLVKFLAWQIAEGWENRKGASFNITQKDVSLLEELRQTLHSLSERYGIKINCPAIRSYTGKTPRLMINSRKYRDFLEEKGYQWGLTSRNKRIPDFILSSDLESIRIFLRNYFDAEASAVISMQSVEISSASRMLIQQLACMLRRFGIWLRISAKQSRATNGSGIFRTYYIGTIGGNSVRRFHKEIGFSYRYKQRLLEEICEKTSNTNVEGIPASDIVAGMVKTTGLPIRHFGMHNTVYINGSQQFSRKSLERVLTATDNVLSGEAERQYRLLKRSKWTAQTLRTYLLLDKMKLRAARMLLERLLTQEVFYCRIKEIEEIDYDGWVYDFEVDKHHNFIANNILCHNTIEVIAFLLREQRLRKQKSRPNLLVCPTSVVGNWQREVARFGPPLEVMVHHGSDRLAGKEFAKAAAEYDLVVTSYGLVRRDVSDLAAVNWRGVMLDEAQNIKNPSSKTAQAVRSLGSEYRFALTGTPVENRLMELWSIMEFLNPGYLGSRKAFNERSVLPIERYADEDATKQLKSLVTPFILRRLKTDPKIITDLPEKLEMKVYCNLTREQVTLYEALVKDMMQQFEGNGDADAAGGIKRRGMILSGLTKLKQLCNHPALFLHDHSDMEGRSGKLQRLVEMLEEVLAEGDKALVFTQFVEMGEAMQEYLASKFRCDVLLLHGGVPQKKRDRMVSLFQGGSDGPPIFIISIRAGGTGLNLTSANHVFHFDRWWNPAVEDQATDRTFRIGQTRNVQVHKFVCSGTLEERIDQLIEKKKSLAESIIGSGEDWLTELSNEDLRKMITLRRDDALSVDER